jgi:hypothetical protein
MKYTTAVTLLSLLLPFGSAGAGTPALRGVGQGLESFLAVSSPELHRELDQCVENPFLGGDADATCCMPMAIDEQYLTYEGEIEVLVTPRNGLRNETEHLVGPISYWYFKIAEEQGGRWVATQQQHRY